MKPIAFSRPYFPGGESEALAETILSGWVAQGPRVAEFERAWADAVGAADAVAVSNGTAALHLALVAAGVGPGDEVVVPSLSFIATANSVWHAGARPVFADIDPATLNLDPAAAERAITPRTRAVMPVHQLGLPAAMDAFLEIGARHGVAILEDAACAMGASFDGRPVGSLPSVVCFSLHARKIITTGEGGMVTTQDPDLGRRLRRLRHHGMDLSDLARHTAKTVTFERYLEKAWNARMTDLQAALGLTQLRVLPEALRLRRAVAEGYLAALGDVDGVRPVTEPEGVRSTWQSFAVRLPEGADRTAVMQRMLDAGVATRRGPTAIHEEPAYEAVEVSLPLTEAASREILLLPIFPELTGGEVERVVAALLEALRTEETLP